ncbi:MAG: 16S rRNA (guanine(966)-N(2))-methyltransferase RsmD [Desulfobulbaceae bacterium DB1]|nr:MAG: 16S rRNA (guanine(966)-N(2))-methyltransferase RsmD [Desulfobulbaceae bacterium DB1]
MRIISGTARGRRLHSPGGGKGDIRPTSDRAREAIFSILGEAVHGARVLDLFAGTGAMGLEALSRGAESALFVDKSQSSISLLQKNIRLCGFWDKSVIVKRDLTRSLFFLQPAVPEGGFSLVFVDPPYHMELADRIVAEIDKADLLYPGAIVIAESRSGDTLPELVSGFQLYDRRSYGEAGFWFYEKK